MLSGLLPQLQCIAAKLEKMQPWRLRIGPHCHNPHHNIFFVSTQAPVPPGCCWSMFHVPRFSFSLQKSLTLRCCNVLQISRLKHVTWRIPAVCLATISSLQTGCREKNMHTQTKQYYLPDLLFNTTLEHQIYYSLQTNHFLALLRTTKLAQSTYQYYCAHKLFPGTTRLAQSTSQYYFVRQSLHKVLPATHTHTPLTHHLPTHTQLTHTT